MTTQISPNLIQTPFRKNFIINGNFYIWQRGVSQTATGYGSDDRWLNEHIGSTKVHSLQSFTVGQTDVPDNPKHYSRTVVTSSAGAGNLVQKAQRIEDILQFSGETVTLSFWAKADATKNIATGCLQLFGIGGSASVDTIGVTTHTLTTAWQRFTSTFVVPSVTGKTVGTGSSLQVEFWFDAGSTFNARTNSLGQQSGTFDIAQVQLERGDVPTDFEYRHLADQLALCQRYYETLANEENIFSCDVTSGSNYYQSFRFAVTKRAVPAVVQIAFTGNGFTSSAVDIAEITGFRHVGTATASTNGSIISKWTADAEL